MDNKIKRSLILGAVLGLMAGIIVTYSIFYLGLLYSITNLPAINIGDIAFNIDINETELVDAAARYMESTP